MSKTKIELSVASSSRIVPVWIGANLSIKELIDFEKYTKVFIITDNNLISQADHFSSGFPHTPKVIITEPGEENKSFTAVSKIWDDLLIGKCDRDSLIINFGGGLVCDLGGFAASTYMRGVRFIQIPTTLLSQVDASVGGKVGINHGGIKNLAGSFNQPEMVICNSEYLNSLPKKEFNSGMAEVIKHGLIKSVKYYDYVKDLKHISKSDQAQIVYGSVEIKASVVSQDEHEKGLRKILNFGHTIGHAIESISQDTPLKYSHGEAIALGMVAEAKISHLQGKLSDSDFESIKMTLQKYQLPIKLASNFPASDIFTKILSDKKNSNNIIKWTLLNKIGQAEFDQQVEPIMVVHAVETII